MDIRERIQQGLNGDFEGLANGFDRINDYIFGLQKKCYYLLGGASGTGKTTLADFILINALMDAEAKGINVNVFYYSFEIDEISKKCNWLSNIAYQKYDRIIAPEKIKGLGKFRLDEDEQLIINDCINDLDKIWSKINFTFQSVNPTGIYNTVWKFMETRGSFIYEEYIDSTGTTRKKIKEYVPKDPKEQTILMMDHLFLLRKERGFSPKEVIDKMSEFFVELRNIFGLTIFPIQQFNQGLSAIDRQKFKGASLAPNQTDFKDSTNPFQDADVVIGLLNPHKYDLEECLGYDLQVLKNMLLVKIIKSRLAGDDIAIGLQTNPKAGSFKELPPSDKIIYSNYRI